MKFNGLVTKSPKTVGASTHTNEDPRTYNFLEVHYSTIKNYKLELNNFREIKFVHCEINDINY